MPEWLAPQLATLVNKPPSGNQWFHEVKLDGYRILAFKQGKKVRLLSRNKKDWTSHFQVIADALSNLPVNRAILDGEIVLLDEEKKVNFQTLQNAFKNKAQTDFLYYVFDLPYLEEWDIRSLPLIERKRLLATLLKDADPQIHFHDHIVGEGKQVFKASCELALEGIVSKLATSTYVSQRSKSWLKIKCIQRQEFVIAGFTPPKNSRCCFGSLYLGVYNNQGEFTYCGNVGTGFSESSLQEVYEALQKRITTKKPFAERPPGIKTATWVKPELVAEIEFSEWTADGHLRHPSFKGLRLDKQAKEVQKEKELPLNKIDQSPLPTNIKLTNGNKIIYPDDNISKRQLFDYYHSISTHILPFITQRPLTLVRCPQHYQDCFYQKKHNKQVSSAVHPVAISSNNGQEMDDYLFIDDEEGLLNLIQLGVIELHPWGSRIETLEYPDMITIDLDPAPDVPWKRVVETAFEVKKHLQNYALQSFVKTTGGKGLHVVVPIIPEYSWGEVNQFTRIFVEFLEQRNPKDYVSVMSKAKRKGKIFIDYLRNQRGATAIAAFSVRARPHAPVATPLDWDELTQQREDTNYTLLTLPKRLAQLKQDPWRFFWTIRQSLRINEL